MEAIKKVKWSYFYGADNAITRGHKWDMSIFTDDCTCEWPGLGKYEGKEACTGFFKGFNDTASFTIHMGHMPNIEVSGDTATGEFYLDCSLTMKEGNRATLITGHYKDIFKKIDGKWYIKDLWGEFYYWTPIEDGWVKTPSLI